MEIEPRRHPVFMKAAFYVTCFVLFANISVLKAQKRPIKLDMSSNVSLKGKDTLVLNWYNEGRRPFIVLGEGMYESPTNTVGFLDTADKVVIGASFGNCSNFVKGYAIVQDKVNGKLGLIDYSGKFIFPANYDAISRCLNGLFCLRKDGFIGFSDIKGKMIVPFGKYTWFATPPPVYIEGDDVGHEGFRWYLLGGLYTVYFGKYLGVKTADKWAVIDSTGKEIIPPRYEGIGIFRGDLTTATIGKKVGVIDTKGNVVVPANYDKIALAGSNYIYVTVNGKTGVLSLRDNKQIIPMAHAYIVKFGPGFIGYDADYKGILYSEDGKRISNAVYNPGVHFPVWGYSEAQVFVYNKEDKQFHLYQDVLDFKSEKSGQRRLFFKRNDKWGLMDTTGRELTGALYSDIYRDGLRYLDTSKTDLYPATLNGKTGILDKNGKVLVPCDYDDIQVEQGKIIVRAGTKFGLLSGKLKVLTPVKYDSIAITHEYENRAYDGSTFFISARLNKKWALLDKNGTELTPFLYDNFLWFYRKMAIVKINGKFGVVGPHGKKIAPCIYDDVKFVADDATWYYFDGRLIVKKDSFYGVIDSTGAEVAPVIYDRIIKLHYPFADKYQVTYHGKIGIFDCISKKIMIPCEYEDLRIYYNDNASVAYGDRREKYPPYIMANKEGYWGVIDRNGKTKLPFIYSSMYLEYDDCYFVARNGKQGLFNKDFKLVVPVEYYFISLIRPGVYVVHKENSLGLITTDGEVIAEALYHSVDFCENKIILKKGDKFGAIDFKGQIILPFEYAEITCRHGQLVPKQ